MSHIYYIIYIILMIYDKNSYYLAIKNEEHNFQRNIFDLVLITTIY